MKFISLIFLVYVMISCRSSYFYSISFNYEQTKHKIDFGQDSEIMTIYSLGRFDAGTFSIYHDFSFNKRLIVNLKDARIYYKGIGFPLNFIAENIKKDTLHIDGDDNLSTIFSIPIKLNSGDTLLVDLKNFLYDEQEQQYYFNPIHLIIDRKTTKK